VVEIGSVQKRTRFFGSVQKRTRFVSLFEVQGPTGTWVGHPIGRICCARVSNGQPTRQEWYRNLLTIAKDRGQVTEWLDIVQQREADNFSSTVQFPLFAGDYWPEVRRRDEPLPWIV
jgi:hypothetical protein